MTKFLSSPLTMGIIASSFLLLLYLTLMTVLSGTFEAAWWQFSALWPYMISLSLGFGLQTGLYTKLKNKIKHVQGGRKMMLGNTSTSTLGMIACCAHHLTDVLPILGLSFLTALLIQYQKVILLVAIASNLSGILYLIYLQRKI
ncbi:hypothetical protein A2781_04485 [Candidatus Gottesmanbacteria bacterium RIFCSPHIGHO2_01_FULL_42_27]|uniref:Uncharacterized protein n=2 Tax=Candidatus Gottesmaniibacteriota TaxID=1752720 RepID=A0A0G0ZE53_9BACT|nr:MAG: hypothetical protein UV09_C0010G0022 [Candidatus Gottesmanbacteria bacterium GW2011_GWA2_42_18]KKS74284.1 MAG: hypothetical protein UV46_C0047G0009 [Candidatus Gottesmanbacteria bacterium GW2011_GWC2_42_8]OGG09911.1 MAG: hypothetical protein A2781_04485 [Candidatus Gottesmanbacteria bacterium RIFCSPHIGHO2_01_FULL_42_27]OGG34447.1 MAG: hypothetical protein A3G68_04545 [Candidatus Gottesmanbacteria bacterium RIFCSPLOWO2_12_FULL_42_10]